MTFKDPHLVMRAKAFASLLRRVTPNQTEVARSLGISRSLMSMYSTAEDTDHNFPAFLLPLHPEAHELLDFLAQELDCEIVPRPDSEELNGAIDDEREMILIFLGKIAEIEQKVERAAVHNLTRQRALKLWDYAKTLRRLAAQMEDELLTIINREAK